MHPSQAPTPADRPRDEGKNSIMRSAIAMSAGTMISRVLGMIRDITLGALFSRTITDAFVVAFRLPNMFRRIFGEGSLSVSFIPVFVDQLSSPTSDPKELREARAKRLAAGIFTFLMCVTSVITALGVVYMKEILEFLIRGEAYLSVPGKLEQTIYLSRIMFLYLFLVTSYAYFSAIANALKHFLIPALAPALFNLVFILVDFLPSSWSQVPGDVLSWGVVAGGVVQALMVAVLLYREGFFPKVVFNWRIPGMWKVLRNMVPGILGLGVLQLTTIVNMSFASRLPEGSHSYIYWADRMLELPQSLIAISLGTALLPTLSQLLSEGRKTEMLVTCNRYLRLLLFLSLPSAVGMFILAVPLVQVLFVRGNFNVQDALATASVVKIYSLLLILSSVSKVVVPGFYAMKNTWLPATFAAISLVVHLGLAQVWVDRFGLVGLTASTTVAGGVNTVLLLIAFWYAIGSIDLKGLTVSLGRQLLPLLIMAAFAHFGYEWSLHAIHNFLPGNWGRAAALLVTVAACIVLYLKLCQTFKSEEAEQVLRTFRRKFASRT